VSRFRTIETLKGERSGITLKVGTDYPLKAMIIERRKSWRKRAASWFLIWSGGGRRTRLTGPYKSFDGAVRSATLTAHSLVRFYDEMWSGKSSVPEFARPYTKAQIVRLDKKPPLAPWG
tara:strand:+ start:5520 stop:5876 length:357 start_codon:yes stop_codon:yes gene_type:complete